MITGQFFPHHPSQGKSHFKSLDVVLFMAALAFVSPSSFPPHSHYEIVLQFGVLGPTPPCSEMSCDWANLIRVISSATGICSGSPGLSQSTLSQTQRLDRITLWMSSSRLVGSWALLLDLKEKAPGPCYCWQPSCILERSWPSENVPNREKVLWVTEKLTCGLEGPLLKTYLCTVLYVSQ